MHATRRKAVDEVIPDWQNQSLHRDGIVGKAFTSLPGRRIARGEVREPGQRSTLNLCAACVSGAHVVCVLQQVGSEGKWMRVRFSVGMRRVETSRLHVGGGRRCSPAPRCAGITEAIGGVDCLAEQTFRRWFLVPACRPRCPLQVWSLLVSSLSHQSFHGCSAGRPGGSASRWKSECAVRAALPETPAPRCRPEACSRSCFASSLQVHRRSAAALHLDCGGWSGLCGREEVDDEVEEKVRCPSVLRLALPVDPRQAAGRKCQAALS